VEKRERKSCLSLLSKGNGAVGRNLKKSAHKNRTQGVRCPNRGKGTEEKAEQGALPEACSRKGPKRQMIVGRGKRGEEEERKKKARKRFNSCKGSRGKKKGRALPKSP